MFAAMVGSMRQALDPQSEFLNITKARQAATTKAELEEAITALDIKRTLEELRREQESSVSSGPDAKKNTCRNRAARRRSARS